MSNANEERVVETASSSNFSEEVDNTALPVHRQASSSSSFEDDPSEDNAATPVHR